MSAASPFVRFGPAHLAALALTILAAVFLPLLLKKTGDERLVGRTAWVLGVVLLAAKITEPFFHLWSGLRWQESLPLHLCDLGGFVAGIMLLNRNYRLYEITYFWGLGGTVQALLTPSVPWDFPHPHFFYYFVTHGLIVVGAIYATVLFRYRPTVTSIWRVFGITAWTALVIAPINWVLDTNYLYLCEKPPSSSLLDYLGPWPWYLLALVPVALVMFWLYYAPFWIGDRLQRHLR